MTDHRWLLIAVCISSFCCSFMGSSLNIAMPFMAQDYGCSPENITWMLSSFTATSASFLLASSALADRFGYLKIYLFGALTSAIVTFGVGLTWDLLSGVTVRLIQGITLSLIFCTAMALVSQRIPKEKRSFAIAYATASVYAGLTFSPIIAGLIVDSLGWQTMFYFTGVMLLLCFFMARTEEADKPLKDSMPNLKMWLSFLIGMVILLSLSYYTTDTNALYLVAVGLVGLIIYLWIEAKSENPLFPIRYILSNKIFCYALLASLFHYLASFGFILLLAMHLQLILGYSASHTGFILFLQPLMMVFFSSLSGKITHFVGPQYLTITGMTLCTSATALLVMLEPNSPLALIITAQVLMGIGFGLFSAPNTIIVMNSVEPQRYSMASAVQSISRTVGQATAMALLTATMHQYVDAEPGTTLYVRELSYSIHISFVSSIIAFGLGLFFCMMCLKNRIKQVKELKALKEQAAASFEAAADTAAKAFAALNEIKQQQQQNQQSQLPAQTQAQEQAQQVQQEQPTLTSDSEQESLSQATAQDQTNNISQQTSPEQSKIG